MQMGKVLRTMLGAALTALFLAASCGPASAVTPHHAEQRQAPAPLGFMVTVRNNTGNREMKLDTAQATPPAQWVVPMPQLVENYQTENYPGFSPEPGGTPGVSATWDIENDHGYLGTISLTLY